MLTFDAPDAVNGSLLAQQLADAGLVTTAAINGDTLELPGLAEDDRATAEPIVAAHSATALAAEAESESAAANGATIRDRAAQALSTNADFLALSSPTNAQNAAQVKALTRQMNGLIRLALGRLDGTE